MHVVLAHALKLRGDMSSRTQEEVPLWKIETALWKKTEETKEEKTIEFDLRTTGC